MNNLTITGFVHQLMPPTSKEINGRNYAAQVMVIDISETSPNLVAIEFDPDRDHVATTVRVNDQVRIAFYPISREGKNANAGNWFTTLRLKRIEIAGRTAATQAASPQAAPAPQATAQATSPIAAAAEESDDNPW
jgi:hypothetical protein